MIAERIEKKVKELEKILEGTEDHPIEVMPNGEIKVDRRKKGSGIINTGKVRLFSSY